MKLSVLTISALLILSGYSCQRKDEKDQFISNSKQSVALNLPNDIESLGKGYDIYGEYASPSSLKFSLFDFSKNFEEDIKVVKIDGILYQLPSIIEVSNQRIKREKVSFGNSLEEISKDLSAGLKIGVDYKIFSGSIEGKYNSKTDLNKEYTYMNHIDATVLRKYELNMNFDNTDEVKLLKRYLRNDAKVRLNQGNYSAKEVFDLYGSHFLANSYIGAKVLVNTVTEKTSQYSESEIAIALEAEISRVSVNAEFKQNDTNKKVLSNSSMNFTALGGKSSLLRSDGSGYMEWAQSIEVNSVLCDFDEKSLVPIWKLCDDDERAKELEDYFYTSYIKRSEFDYVDKIKKNTNVFSGNFTNSNKNEFVYFDNEGLKLVTNGQTLNIGNYNMKLGEWTLGYDEILGVGDFNGDKKSDILIKSWWGIGILSLDLGNNQLKSLYLLEYNKNIDNHKLNKEDQVIVGNFLNKDKTSIAITGNNGLNILDFNEKATKLQVVSNFPYKTKSIVDSKVNWSLEQGDKIFRINDYNNDLKDDIVIQSSNGLGLLTLKYSNFNVTWANGNGTAIGSIDIDNMFEFFSFDSQIKFTKPLIAAIKRRENDTKDKLVFFIASENGLTSYFHADFNTNLDSWNLRNDKILGTIMSNKNKPTLIIESDWGRGLLELSNAKVNNNLHFKSIYLSKFN